MTRILALSILAIFLTGCALRDVVTHWVAPEKQTTERHRQ